jgi:hypothetical protein
MACPLPDPCTMAPTILAGKACMKCAAAKKNRAIILPLMECAAVEDACS